MTLVLEMLTFKFHLLHKILSLSRESCKPALLFEPDRNPRQTKSRDHLDIARKDLGLKCSIVLPLT